VDQAVQDAREPLVGVLAAEVTVARVEVDSDGLAADGLLDAVEAGGEFAVLLVRLDADEYAARRTRRGSSSIETLWK